MGCLALGMHCLQQHTALDGLALAMLQSLSNHITSHHITSHHITSHLADLHCGHALFSELDISRFDRQALCSVGAVAVVKYAKHTQQLPVTHAECLKRLAMLTCMASSHFTDDKTSNTPHVASGVAAAASRNTWLASMRAECVDARQAGHRLTQHVVQVTVAGCCRHSSHVSGTVHAVGEMAGVGGARMGSGSSVALGRLIDEMLILHSWIFQLTPV